jgi:hypothetical protein
MRRADSAMYEAKKHGRNQVSAHPETVAYSGRNPGGADVDHLSLLHTA